jgi:hypothetical protein
MIGAVPHAVDSEAPLPGKGWFHPDRRDGQAPAPLVHLIALHISKPTFPTIKVLE